MKTRWFRMDWLVLVVGFGVVAGCLVARTSHRELEGRERAAQALMPALDRLYQDYAVSLALKSLRDGQVDLAAQRLDLLLCWDILRADAELATADARTRAWTEDMFRRIARTRPKNPEGAPPGSGQECGAAQESAQRVLELVLATDNNAQRK